MAQQPGLIDKLRWTIKFYRQGYPRMMQQSKAAPFIWPAWRMGKPEWQLVNLDSYVEEGFNANSLIYSAVMYKAKAVTASPLRAYSGDHDHPDPLDEGHPLAKLLARPNSYQSQREFQQLNVVYLNVTGNCYVYMDRKPGAPYPEAMYSLRPDRVRIVPLKKGAESKIGFVYVPEGRPVREGTPILPQYLMHVKLPNPWDPLEGMGYGLSPISAMARSADVDNMATEFLQRFFQKGAMPLGFLSFKDVMDPSSLSYAQEQWDEIYGGYKNWTDVAALDRDAEYRRVTPTFEEMAFQNIDERNEARVLGPFGVPAVLLGMRSGLKHATYSNAEELRRMFWEDTMIPETGLFETEFRYFLQGEGKEFVGYDYSKVPALQKDIPTLTKAYFELVQGGVPPNTAAETVGLPIQDIPGGDIGYMPFNMMPVGQERQPLALPAGQPASSEEEDRDKSLGWSEERKERLWKAVDSVATSWEGRFGDAAAERFGADKRKVLSILNAGHKKAVEAKATIDWEAIYQEWMTYLDMAGEEWRKTFLPLMKGVITDQARTLGVAYGMAFDVGNLWAQEWFDDYTMTFAEAIVHTSRKAMSEMFKQGVAEGWSIPTMQKGLEQLFTQWTEGNLRLEEWAWIDQRMPKYRREMIARTETIRASNKGAEALYGEWGVEYKEWLTAFDKRTCVFCAQMNGKRLVTGATWFQKGEQWNVEVEEDGEIKIHSTIFNYEDIKGPPLHPNCRCTLIPWRESWEGWQ